MRVQQLRPGDRGQVPAEGKSHQPGARRRRQRLPGAAAAAREGPRGAAPGEPHGAGLSGSEETRPVPAPPPRTVVPRLLGLSHLSRQSARSAARPPAASGVAAQTGAVKGEAFVVCGTAGLGPGEERNRGSWSGGRRSALGLGFFDAL